MINLRQGRWLQAVCDACSAKSSLAVAALPGVMPVALLAALLVPGAAALAAPPHSHARRPLPTSLHSYSLTETASHTGGKKRHSSLKSKTGVQADTRQTGARGSGKGKAKGRGRRAEPVDDPVPMFRAARDSRHGHLGSPHAGATVATAGRHGRYLNQPAPLASSFHRGHAFAPPPRMSASAARATFGGVSHWHALSSDNVGTAQPAPIVRRPPPVVASTAGAGRPDVYAEGFAHPDHPDEQARLPRARSESAAGGGDYGEAAPTPVAHVSASPQAPTLPTASVPSVQPQVVQGFGGEIAVPSPASAPERPGGTRRRSHPSTWSPEPTALTSEPLEEREAITYAAISPAVLPEIYDRNGRLAMPAPLKGSHDVLVHQNLMADNDGLERIQNDADLERMRAAHLLVTLPASESLHVNDDLPANRRVARPWTAMFANDLAHAFYTRFHEPIYVTSAVRTVSYQAHLQMVNGNAAAIAGEAASPHLTGQAIDMAKRGMSREELAWMRDYLLPLMRSGKIDVEEEFQQACFHVSVYRSYAAGRRMVVHEMAQVHSAAPPVRAVTDTGADEPEDR